MKDTHKRSIFKTISWRVVATLITMSLVFIVTGSLALAAEIGFFEVILKILIYYLHERAWSKIKWGRHMPKNSSS